MSKSLAMLKVLICVSIFCISTTATAQWDIAKNVTVYRLPNGMTWLLVRRPTPNIFAGAIAVKVGGIEETPPHIGLAHMFEHMAFKGTHEIGTTDYNKEAPLLKKIQVVGDDWVKTANPESLKQLQDLQKQASQYQRSNDLFTLLSRSGARDINAFTSKDLTQYHSVMPANQLGLWLYLYAGMVNDPILREFYSERNVVQEERRMRVENSPQGKAYETLLLTAYSTSPYRYTTIGTAEQIGSLSVGDATAFHQKFYHPDRMYGALVGDVNIAQAKAYINKYFASMPGTRSPKDNFPKEPVQTETRRATVHVNSAPFLMMAFHKPRVGSDADYVFDVIDYTLCQGATSRLQKKLVTDEKIAQNISCASGIPGNRLDNLYYIEAYPIKGHSTKELEERIMAELQALRDTGITDKELKIARNNLASNFLWEMQSNDDLAELLVDYQAITGDWRYVLTHASHIEAIGNSDVKKVAQTYLVPTNLTVVTAE
ncbi:MAG: hypothetical protein COV45_02620 [Deltaproteobacteria bacterium CG11_big_fil_rev_8_21_14_0_20_47_16]|nr:MAG: hypothetical protein COV45_02620 [Deltaproteobacteria bacterium CG11_big_fil_rev_8_21_14_0_20_47_16]